MRLTKVLLPEVIKGSRSSGLPTIDSIYRDVDLIKFNKDGICVPETLFEEKHRGWCDFLVQAKKHLVEKAPTYHICREFGEALLNLKSKEIVSDLLPENFFAYISFPTDLIKGFQGAYVYLGINDDTTPFLRKYRGKKIIWISFVGDFNQEGAYHRKFNFYLEQLEGKTIEEIEDFYGQHEDNFFERGALGNLIINTLLYLNSQCPEVLDLMPSFNAPVSKQKSHTVKNHLNLCTISVKAINWDYSSTKVFHDSKIWVDGFLAWRRCGPRHSQIKLSWISEHEKIIKKIDRTIENTIV